MDVPDPPDETPAPTPGPTALEPFPSPAPPGARFPELVATPGGGVVLTWMRGTEDGAALEAAVLEGDAFGAARTIVEHPDLMVNWADGGSVAIAATHWTAWWLQRAPGGYHAYVARSDDGEAWSDGVRLHDHDGRGEHGFVVALPDDDGATVFAWLDGRAWADDATPDETMLLTRSMDAAGTLGPETALDERGCDCCPTSGTVTDDGAVLAYRDRTVDEVRDMAVVTHDGEGWSEPVVPVEDGWTIDGCPVNGPSIVSNGPSTLLTWLTAADDQPRVQAVRLNADGAADGPAFIVASGRSVIGRVDSLLRDDGGALITWVARDGSDSLLRARWLLPDDTLGDPFDVSPLPPGSGTGTPRILDTPEGILVAWTAPTDPATVELGLIR